MIYIGPATIEIFEIHEDKQCLTQYCIFKVHSKNQPLFYVVPRCFRFKVKQGESVIWLILKINL